MRLAAVMVVLAACASVGRSVDDTEPLPDFDGDGIPDVDDPDADGDGIPDVEDDFVDLDGDGFDRLEDCDDADAAVNPGADEICGNGKDDDCDGSAGACRLEGELDLTDVADVVVRGAQQRDGFGQSVTFIGDADEDGFSDLLIGAGNVGSAWRFSGGESGSLGPRAAATTYQGDSPQFARAVSGGGDLTGDGAIDVVLSEPTFSDAQRSGVGRSIVRPALDGEDPFEPSVVLGRSAQDFLGQATHVLEDVDDNGLADLWVSLAGVPTLVGVSDGLNRVESVLRIVPSPGVTLSLPAAGDMDGDGRADILLQRDDRDGVVFLAPDPGGYEDVDADIIGVGGSFFPPAPLRSGGLQVSDLDGDGYDDAILAMGALRFGGDALGEVRIARGGVAGPAPSYTSRLVAGPEVEGSEAFRQGVFGGLIEAADLDLDGRPDLIVGLNSDLAIFYAPPVDGERSVADWDALIPASFENAPVSLDVAPERNADATTSLAIGYGVGAGQVYLLRVSGL